MFEFPGRKSLALFWSNSRKIVQHIGLAFRLAWLANWKLTVGVMALAVAQAMLLPLGLVLSKLVIDRVVFDLGIEMAPDPVVLYLPLAGWIVLAVVCITASQLLQPCITTVQSLLGDRITGYVTGQLIRTANTWSGLAYFEDAGFADDLQRARDHAATGGLNLMISITYSVVALLIAVGLSWTLFRLHPLFPICIIIAVIPQLVMQWRFVDRVSHHTYYRIPKARRLEYYRQAVMTPELAKDVRLYGLGSFFQHRYNTCFEETLGELNRIRRRLAWSMTLTSMLSAFVVGAVYSYVVWLVASGSQSLGDLVIYGGAALMLRQQLEGIGQHLHYLPQVMTFLPSVFQVLNTPSDLPVPKTPRPVPQPLRSGIVFENVEFTYPGCNKATLMGVNLAIRPGERLALVGQNGAGKTTIVKLLLRLYDPTGGRVLLDGADLRSFDPLDLRQTTSAIFQDFIHFELTAGENIGLGQVKSLSDRQQILNAAAKGGAMDLIHKLPDGLGTRLGRSFGGYDLSGGEWQRLALARAFMRDFQLLILDEPTSALDVQAEYDLYNRVLDLTQGKMTLLISHRLSTVRMADRIIYLDNGRVLEEGTHAELMQHNGAYAQLYRLQASRYASGEADPVAYPVT